MREELLSIIEKNSRIDFSELAILLGTTEDVVLDELSKLENEGIICGYHTLINWEKTSIEKVTGLIEVKVTPQFAVRAGASWTGSGMNDDLKNGNVEVVTVGTLPHYTIDRGITNYTVGFGYRFTPQFYVDVACVLKTLKEDAYAFSSIYSNEGESLATAIPASMKTKTTRVALTLGYKF